MEYIVCCRAWLAALRGDAPAAQAALAGLGDLQATEDPQDRGIVAVVEAFTAAAVGQPAKALRCAQTVLGHAGGLAISSEQLRWSWPLCVTSSHAASRQVRGRYCVAAASSA